MDISIAIDNLHKAIKAFGPTDYSITLTECRILDSGTLSFGMEDDEEEDGE